VFFALPDLPFILQLLAAECSRLKIKLAAECVISAEKKQAVIPSSRRLERRSSFNCGRHIGEKAGCELDSFGVMCAGSGVHGADAVRQYVAD
jgi:hypothetical protein